MIETRKEVKLDESFEALVEVEINDDMLSLGIKHGKEILDAIVFFESLPLDNNKIQQFAIYVNKHALINYNVDYNQDEATLILGEVAYE